MQALFVAVGEWDMALDKRRGSFFILLIYLFVLSLCFSQFIRNDQLLITKVSLVSFTAALFRQKLLVLFDDWWDKGFGCVCHASSCVVRAELMIILLVLDSRGGWRLLLLHLLLGKEHTLELLDLCVELIQHFFLHGKHLIFDLHLFFQVLLSYLLHLNLSL